LTNSKTLVLAHGRGIEQLIRLPRFDFDELDANQTPEDNDDGDGDEVDDKDEDESDGEDELELEAPSTFKYADVVQVAQTYPSQAPAAAEMFELQVKPREMLKRDEDSGVCRVIFNGIPVVIKFVISSDPRRVKALQDEGRIYVQRLQDLQGDAIPCLYALFSGESEDEGFTLSVACIFMEDCGDRVSESFIFLVRERSGSNSSEVGPPSPETNFHQGLRRAKCRS